MTFLAWLRYRAPHRRCSQRGLNRAISLGWRP